MIRMIHGGNNFPDTLTGVRHQVLEQAATPARRRKGKACGRHEARSSANAHYAGMLSAFHSTTGQDAANWRKAPKAATHTENRDGALCACRTASDTCCYAENLLTVGMRTPTEPRYGQDGRNSIDFDLFAQRLPGFDGLTLPHV